MALIGYHCSHEQYTPSALLRNAALAEKAGFDGAMCSDHFQPWSERQGHSAYAWSWLGAALERTRLSFGTVCAPGQRYHPAIVAQAAATLCEMYGERFWLALGSGEALNESITGAPWPDKAARNAKLGECVEVMRALWAGETVDHDGLVRVRSARLHVECPRPPPLFGACLTSETAHWVGGWADGMITVAGSAEHTREIVSAFRSGGGVGKPMYLQVPLSFAATDAEALAAAHDQWRQVGLSGAELADLESPAAFDRATGRITPGELRAKMRVSARVEQHAEWLARDIELGFERLFVHNVHRDQERFISEFAQQVLPALRSA
jgi:coenzyme F420-dependent glucose-6-phosphate dehydrogenase